VKSKLISIIFTAAILSWTEASFAQGFTNLNFESATFDVDPAGRFYPYSVYASNAIPGWTAYIGGFPQTDILSNGFTLNDAAVSLQGTNGMIQAFAAFAGQWSILLQASYQEIAPATAAIGQTGLIPLLDKSLIFCANTSLSVISNNLQVTFNGSIIPYSAIGAGIGYTIYGANISGFAGQTGQLLFTAGYDTYAELDNIQFSSSPIPEPSAFYLAALGALFLGFRRRRR
jgi:hypothetical protein